MLSSPAPLRLWTTVGLLLGAYLLLHTLSHGEPIIPHQSLRDLPYTMRDWKGQELVLPEEAVHV